MNSFYGGKEGRTYHIVARYDSVAQMIDQFQKGGAYTEANYGQYVLIDTIMNNGHYSDEENGLLFRRGFDYNEEVAIKPNRGDYIDSETGEFDKQGYQSAWSAWVNSPGGGAIYVGQIVGPKGDAPELTAIGWSEFIETSTEGKRSSFILDKTPGKDGDEFNDNIRMGYANILDADGDIVGCYISFDIPYTVFEVDVVDSDPYSTAKVEENDVSKSHPFYKKWDFTIPQGKHGADLEEIVLEKGSAIGEGQVDSDGNAIVEYDDYLTYAIRDYEENAEGAITGHLGRWPYRVIKEITTQIQEREYFTNWNTQAEVSIGTLSNLPGTEYKAICIQGGTISGDGIIQPAGGTYVLGEIIQSDTSAWRVVNIPETAPACALNIDYRAGQNGKIEHLRMVDYFYLDDDGRMYVVYSTQGQSEEPQEPQYLTTLNSIKDIVFNEETGNLEIYYYGSDNPLEFGLNKIKDVRWENSEFRIEYFGGEVYSRTVKEIDRLELKNQDNLKEQQKFVVKYVDLEEEEEISDAVNTILAIKQHGDNLIALYSDPNFRDSIEQSGTQYKDWYKVDWIDPITGTEYTGANRLVWANFGPIGSQFHVQGVYTYEELETTYKDGLGSEAEGTTPRDGWIVSVLEQIEDPVTGQITVIKHLYAFDYHDGTVEGKYEFPDGTATHWYEIMSVSEAVASNPANTVLVSDVDPNDETKPKYSDSELKENGIWFVTSYGHDDY